MNVQLKKKMMTSACRYSYTRLSLNYYMFYEMMAEKENHSAAVLDCCGAYVNLLDAFLSGNASLTALEDLRNQVSRHVEAITSYTDCFQIYEYVLNRLERKFEEEYSLPEADEIFTGKLMQFISGSRDSAVVNERIQTVISQLPVRFTKAKFFSMVQEALSIYIGSPKQSLDDMMYMLSTEAMLKKPEPVENGDETLAEILASFQTMDVKNMTKEQCKEYMDKLVFASRILLDDSGDFMVLMDMINDLYVILLSRNQAMLEVGETKEWTDILSSLTERMKKEEFEAPDDKIFDMMEHLEGKQERYYESFLRQEDGSEDEECRKISLLLSNSPFVSLEKQEENLTEVDRKLLEKETERFFQELEALWKDMPKAVVRATMARVLSALPVCFNSFSQVEEYIKGSLASCSDMAEKSISQELLAEIMESENGFL